MGLYTCTKVLNPNKGYSCVFRQHRATSHCNRLHGYDLIFSITLEADHDKLDLNGWVYDYGGFKALDKRLSDHFDHKLVVAEDDPYLDGFRSMHHGGIADVVVLPRVGCEAFACWLAVEATNMLYDTGDLGRVRVRSAMVSENGANHASYIP